MPKTLLNSHQIIFVMRGFGSGLALFVGPKRERRKDLVSTVCANCYWFSSNAKISLLGGAEQKKNTLSINTLLSFPMSLAVRF